MFEFFAFTDLREVLHGIIICDARCWLVAPFATLLQLLRAVVIITPGAAYFFDQSIIRWCFFACLKIRAN
jgi:hypothetical protein